MLQLLPILDQVMRGKMDGLTLKPLAPTCSRRARTTKALDARASAEPVGVPLHYQCLIRSKEPFCCQTRNSPCLTPCCTLSIRACYEQEEQAYVHASDPYYQGDIGASSRLCVWCWQAYPLSRPNVPGS